jgi:acyl transferase domain-containing protein
VPGAPEEPRHWWGAPDAAWYRGEGLDAFPFRGYYVEDLRVRPDRFRIPPKELEEMLPQQTLMLWPPPRRSPTPAGTTARRLRAGVVIGLGLDLNTTNFHVRWSLLNEARDRDGALGLGLSDAERGAWTQALRDAAGPPLTANRTMGALGGLVASRVAREFRVGGPSFTVSSEETSGLRALEVAVGLLRRGEIDEAVVGAVDLAGDLRAVLASAPDRAGLGSGEARPFDERADGAIPGDGAAAVVLKRLDDAVRDGDRIYAVVRGLGAASGGGVDLPCPDVAAYRDAMRRGYLESGVAPASVGYLAAHGSGRPGEDRREAERWRGSPATGPRRPRAPWDRPRGTSA